MNEELQQINLKIKNIGTRNEEISSRFNGIVNLTEAVNGLWGEEKRKNILNNNSLAK